MLRLNVEALQRAMQRAKIGPVQLARRAGLHRNTVHTLLTRKREPSLSTVSAIAKVLGVSPFTLLIDDED